MTETYKSLAQKSIWTAIILFGIRLFIEWKWFAFSFDLYSCWGYAGEAIGITSVLTVAYEKWLWRYNKFESTPVLKKKYVGTLLSNYDNIHRSAELIIQQTLLSVHVTLISEESQSWSISSSIDNIGGTPQLIYCYHNKPKTEFRRRSEIHYGTAMLRISSPEKLSGSYYTDRNTGGDMEFTASA